LRWKVQSDNSNPNFDLAILAFPKISRQIQLISFGDEDPQVKESIAIMGYPNIKMMAITMGTVINYDTIELPLTESTMLNIDFEVMVTYAPVKPGSSGSLVINENHQLVGIVFSAYFPPYRDISEATFIIPVSQVLAFISLAKEGEWI
jgi:serine protease Do